MNHPQTAGDLRHTDNPGARYSGARTCWKTSVRARYQCIDPRKEGKSERTASRHTPHRAAFREREAQCVQGLERVTTTEDRPSRTRLGLRVGWRNPRS